MSEVFLSSDLLPSRLLLIVIPIVWLSSAAVISSVKALLKEFPNPIFVSFLNNCVLSVQVYILLHIWRRVNAEHFRHMAVEADARTLKVRQVIFAVSVIQALELGCSNMSLGYLPLFLRTTIASTGPVLMLVVSNIWFTEEAAKVSKRATGAIALTTLGGVFMSLRDQAENNSEKTFGIVMFGVILLFMSNVLGCFRSGLIKRVVATNEDIEVEDEVTKRTIDCEDVVGLVQKENNIIINQTTTGARGNKSIMSSYTEPSTNGIINWDMESGQEIKDVPPSNNGSPLKYGNDNFILGTNAVDRTTFVGIEKALWGVSQYAPPTTFFLLVLSCTMNEPIWQNNKNSYAAEYHELEAEVMKVGNGATVAQPGTTSSSLVPPTLSSGAVITMLQLFSGARNKHEFEEEQDDHMISTNLPESPSFLHSDEIITKSNMPLAEVLPRCFVMGTLVTVLVVSEVRLMQLVSTITYSVLSVVHNLLIVGCGLFLFGEQLTFLQWIGVFLAQAGTFAYAVTKGK